MAEGYKPTDGMKSAARRALQWKKEGKRGGTRIGLTRANQIVNNESLSESTVMRMYSFFSRHEVDKQATGFSSGEEGFPSPGRVAWDLWGGDAGYSWSRQKAQSIKNKREMRKMSSIWDGAFLGELGRENVAEVAELEEVDAPLEPDTEPAVGNNTPVVEEVIPAQTPQAPSVVEVTEVKQTTEAPVQTEAPVVEVPVATQEPENVAPTTEEPKAEVQDAAPVTDAVQTTADTVSEASTTEQPTE
jgi:hypothetical protein